MLNADFTEAEIWASSFGGATLVDLSPAESISQTTMPDYSRR
jgi:hypothetical protein